MVAWLFLSYNVDSINKGLKMSKEVMQQALDALLKPTSSAKIAEITKSIRVELVKPDGWHPIETVPNDMASRLYLVKGFCVQGFVDATGVLCAQNDRQTWRKMAGKPTHWMPLPKAPI